jgi:hypothetical protein
MPASVAENPGGVVTVRPLRFWFPSFLVSSIAKGLCAPEVLPAAAASNPGSNGLVVPGHGVPLGPELRVKNWVEVWVPMVSSHGVKVVVTG